MSATRTFGLSVLLFALWLLAFPAYSVSAERHALVIGNSNYGGGFALANPQKDAQAIGASLASLGYTIHGSAPQYDLQLDSFNDVLDQFLASVEDGSSTLVYYAGHGAASSGNNYLIPILPDGVVLKSESDIRDRSISLQSVLDRLETVNPTGVNVFLYDACRDAPVDNFSRSINISGLAPLDIARQPRGSFVGFSTEYGDIALDDNESGHSPFASAVLTNLKDNASAPIELFFKSITENVYDVTGGQQFPIQESKIRGKHCIIECETLVINDQSKEFGQLAVVTSPVNAEVCYLIAGWASPNCGKQVVLPTGRDVRISVTAKGYKPYTAITSLTEQRQQLKVDLEPKSNNTLKIIGGVAAAAIITGVLISRDSDGESSEPTTTLTLVRPN